MSVKNELTSHAIFKDIFKFEPNLWNNQQRRDVAIPPLHVQTIWNPEILTPRLVNLDVACQYNLKTPSPPVHMTFLKSCTCA